MTSSEAREKWAKKVARRRYDEALCALDFLTWGDTRGVHAKFCVHGKYDPCSRTYDPWPYQEASPDPHLYEGTGIGALYGMRGSERHLWQLAGWNLTTLDFTAEDSPTEGNNS